MKTFLLFFLFGSFAFGSGLFGLGGNPQNNYVGQTASLVTTGTAAQNLFSRTTTVGKTFFITYLEIEGYFTAVSATGVTLGTCSLQIPAGTTTATFSFQNPTNEALDRVVVPIPNPIPASASVAVSCAAHASTSTTWYTNVGGYEN
jgi:hypothetical protein